MLSPGVVPPARTRTGRLVAFAGRRPTLAAAVLYALLALLLTAPGMVPGRTLSASDYLWSTAPWIAQRPAGVRPDRGANGEMADSVAAFQPFLQYARERLPAPPLWNPYVMAGRPFFANAQSALLSPFSWPSFVLPFWFSLAIAAALKLLCAALGAFVLARALGQRFAGALLAGLAFGFSLWMVTWLSWPLASVWAFLPWLLAAVDAVVRRPSAARVGLLALATALCFFAGHPESFFHAIVAAVLFAALRVSRRERRARAAGAVVVGLVAGAALSAVLLLPFLELLRDSADVADRASRAAGFAPRKYLLGMALPEYWGRPTQATIEPFLNARAWYVGALPLLLAGLAVLRPARERIAIAVAGALALAVVLGVQPVFGAVTALPGFAQSANTRLAVLTCLCLALLAGWGLDDLMARRRIGRLGALWLAAALVLPLAVAAAHARLGLLGHAVAVAVGAARLHDGPDLYALAPTAAAVAWLGLCGAGIALAWAAARGRLRGAALAGGAIALTALDLVRFGMGQNPSIPLDHARQPVTGAVRALQAARPARFAGVVPDTGIVALPADVGMRYGLYDARGYDYPIEQRYDAFWRRAIAPRLPFIPPTTLARADDESLRALGLLGVRDLLQQPGDVPLALPLVYSGSDARVYANPHAQPRAWVVDRTRPVAGEGAALDAVTARGFDPRAAAVVEGRVPGVPAGAGGAGAQAGSAAIARYDPERVDLDVRARRRSLAILSDVWFPGWHATVDGRPADIERVDYLLRGVVVPPGRHVVAFRYVPASVIAGLVVSVLTALALIAAGLVERLRRRPRGLAAAAPAVERPAEVVG